MTPDGSIPAGDHLVRRTLTEEVLTPDHPPRTASAEFERNRSALLAAGHGCLVCGSKGSAEHPLEAHHWIEWSGWEHVDPAKMAAVLQRIDVYGYGAQLGAQPIQSPDDIRNLVLLCSSAPLQAQPVAGGHHRGVDMGIHMVTFPIWLLQLVVRDGVDVTAAIASVKAKDPAMAGPQPAGG